MNTPRLFGTPAVRKTFVFGLAFLLLAVGWTVGADEGASVLPFAEAKEEGPPPTSRSWSGRWSEEVLDLVATIPVQSAGRVKPLHTWAGFTLLASNHRRSCKDANGEKYEPLEWFMDAVFRPKLAKDHRCFLVATTEVLDAMGMTEEVREKRKIKKRDRYSYNDLVPDAKTRRKLSALAARHQKTDAKMRTRIEGGLVSLDMSLRIFEGLLHMLDFARVDLRVDGSEKLEEHFNGAEYAPFSDVLAKAPALVDPHAGHGHEHGSAKETPEAALLSAAMEATRRSTPLAMLPPSGAADSEPQWFALRDVAFLATQRGIIDAGHLEAVRAFEGMMGSIGNERQFVEHLESYHTTVKSLADSRGEYEKIEQEVAFYQLDPFGKSKVYYLIAFALLCVTWLRPQWRWLEILAWVVLWATLALHTYGIVQRCIIRDRPPISTLYETVIFITGAGVLSLLLIEHMSRRMVALALAPIVGWLGLFIAGRYEVLDGKDTMTQLPAVLDTNFWLTTHVTAISIGYCAGLLAGIIAHVYVLGKVFRFKRNDSAFYAAVGKMVYGTICFALLFSLIGTILGGIWANDSWGRFWGWDPKENGALLICISQLAILHGRMGGLFKMFGVCQAAILGGVIVAFSWWGVNLLGIGLHSYGFTSGIMRALMIFYGIEGAVMLAGLYAWLRDRPKKRVITAS